MRTKIAKLAAPLWVCLASLALAGCTWPAPTVEELAAFEKAGPVRPQLDVDRILNARLPAGRYRLSSGDVVELLLPPVLTASGPEWSDKAAPCLCRVSEDGSVLLPNAGKVHVAGKTLDEAESAVASAYFPRYVVRQPAVVARVAEQVTVPVKVVGAVRNPGIYELKADELSLVGALMKSGGIAPQGATYIRVIGPSAANDPPVILPVKDLNIPFADIALAAGQTVEVQRMSEEVFTVVGLVNKQGVYAYPPTAEYSLAQALAIAGGVNLQADPRYAKIYRQDAEGKMLAVAFRIDGENMLSAAGVKVKPGDVVAVEMTPETRARLILTKVLYLGAGLNVGATYRID